MIETTILLQDIDPMILYGVNNNKLDVLKKAFPLLKMVFRGDKIKVSGKVEEIEQFELKMRIIVDHIMKYQDISQKDIEKIALNDNPDVTQLDKPMGDIICYGNNGHVVRARTPNQKVMVEQNLKNDILFAVGPAGTGKTYTAVALAVKAWKEKQVKRIILTRPAVEAGESLGFLPGDMREKVDPYLRPLYDALEDMIPFEKLTQLKETRIIEVAPLAFMRGRTLDNAFIILDEAQNATSMQLKMFLTRIGPNAKCIVTGDVTQIDLPKSQQSGLPFTLQILKGIDGIGIVQLTKEDVIRHRLVAKIIEAFEENSEK